MTFAIETQALSLGAEAPARFRSILFTETRGFAFAGGAGSLRTNLARIGSEGLAISRVVSTGHEIEVAESDRAMFLAPARGRLDIRVGKRRQSAAAGRLLAFGPSQRNTRAEAAAGTFLGHVVMLPARRLAELRDPGARAAPPEGAAIEGAAARRLATYAAFLLDEILAAGAAPVQPRTAERIAALLEDLVAEAAAEAFPDGAAMSPASAERVRLAEEIMRARSDEPIAMHALAREIGVGLRSLQLAFRGVRGEEPRAALARIRLERAQERLLAASGGETVTGIALDCGFTHLGRFAQAYRRAFGERPSETLARRR